MSDRSSGNHEEVVFIVTAMYPEHELHWGNDDLVMDNLKTELEDYGYTEVKVEMRDVERS